MKQLAIISLFIFFTGVTLSQEISVDDYIKRYSGIAVQEMKRYGIPASITLAQGILESGAGNSNLARKANNHFGIKCHKGWEGKTFHMDDDEKDECFRKYDNPEESYHDHSIFLTTRDRYSFLFDLEVTDYKGWAKGLKQAGYATNPLYPDLLIRIIEENDLARFDRGGAGGKKVDPVTKKESVQLVPENPKIDMEKVGKSRNDREIFENNKVRCTIARKGDTWESIAREFGIYGWQVRQYNDLGKKDDIKPGEVIYLERKRMKSEHAFHIVEEGETMRNISQRYAVKMKALYRLNGMENSEEPVAGEAIRLK